MLLFEQVDMDFSANGRAVPAVRGVDLAVEAGEIVTLVGPSGCGKSTLLNITAGLFAPSRGRALYNGAPIRGINTRVGYMTQNDHLLPWRDVLGNISVPMEIAGLSQARKRERAEELLSLVGLSGFEKAYPAQLSGGMRKRAALARLLAQDPETLLMDEPFGALDAQLRLLLQAELRRVAKRFGKTVLFVTHDLDEAVAIADRCVIFAGRPGRIAEVLPITLPVDRDLFKLRFDPAYNELCARLWSIIAPELASGLAASQ
ncbi:MAG: ABC transporter ATP-binding protein [Bosea sp.]|uniref:ABC transporter ATP-binding protein n=1 Tax=Bosea sp. (in: a-proteobacteria) TaxID=1871050 RepID=UPI001AD54C85|nr:ABC transporter ATP-binding protein [Bosea sp. (in: a-proteobacteria)]MBN9453920.1 ABC transporter ATP-binding protein [Bosea sp. (in: a-proteobacteria)]